MKKLLVLALLGLILGAGAWKSQNPDGTVDEAVAQASDVVNRLKAGAMTVRDSSTRIQAANSAQDSPEQPSMPARLALIEASLAEQQASNGRQSTIDELAVSLSDALASTEANMVRLDAIDSRLELVVRRLDEQSVDQKLAELQGSVEAIGIDPPGSRQSRRYFPGK